MRILYFGSFDQPYDSEVYVSNTLESLGYEVNRQSTSKVNASKMKVLLQDKYDFILLSKGWFIDQDDCVRLLKESPILKVGWFWDLCWDTPREWLLEKHHLFKADIVFTSDGGKRDWAKYGIKHETLRQGIYEPEAVRGEIRKDYELDVVFVGTLVHDSAFGWKHRSELVNFLKRNYGDRFKLFGVDDGVRNKQLNDLYASAKVVVGDSVYAPEYWSNRLYETLGRNGFLIFPTVEGIEKEFTPYKHFIPYNYYDFEGLAEKIDYYLDHDSERDKIKEAGFEHCKQYHTYTIRCQQLIDYIKNYGKSSI